MLVDRPSIIIIVTLMAAASAFATWTPWPAPAFPAPRRPGAGPAPDRRPRSGPVPSPPRSPAVRAGTMEE
jgi:hypothetical protein